MASGDTLAMQLNNNVQASNDQCQDPPLLLEVFCLRLPRHGPSSHDPFKAPIAVRVAQMQTPGSVRATTVWSCSIVYFRLIRAHNNGMVPIHAMPEVDR